MHLTNTVGQKAREGTGQGSAGVESSHSSLDLITLVKKSQEEGGRWEEARLEAHQGLPSPLNR